MISELSWLDITTVMVGLFAAILAATKDTLVKRPVDSPSESGEGATRKERYFLDFSKLTPTGMAAILLALISFSVALYNTNRAKVSARNSQAEVEELKKTTLDIKDISGVVLKEVKIQLPEFVRQAIEKSGDQINEEVTKAVGSAVGDLSSTISTVTKNSETQLKTSIKDATNSFETTRKDLIQAVTDLKTEVGTSQASLKTSVQDELGSLPGKIQGALNGEVDRAINSIKESSKNVVSDFRDALGTQIMQIPLQVAEHSYPRRLPGKLSDLLIQVGEVSKKHKFSVEIMSENKAPINISCGNILSCTMDGNKAWVDPKAKATGEPPSVLINHEGKTYKVRMFVQADYNIFGSATDYLICEIGELTLVQAKQ